MRKYGSSAFTTRPTCKGLDDNSLPFSQNPLTARTFVGQSQSGNGAAKRYRLSCGGKSHTSGNVTGIETLWHDAIVHRRGPWRPPTKGKSEGDKVEGFSVESAAALRLLVNNCNVQWSCMVVLTYGRDYPLDGSLVKADLNLALNAARKAWGRFKYVWCLEYQDRGAPHIHLLVDLPVRVERLRYRRRARMFVATDGEREAKLQKWWSAAVREHHRVPSFGLVVRWEILRDVDGGQKYISAYASKPEQKRVPEGVYDVGRFWGASRDVKVITTGFISLDEKGLATIYGGKERAWNGEVYKLLHGGAKTLEEHKFDQATLPRKVERKGLVSAIRESRFPDGKARPFFECKEATDYDLQRVDEMKEDQARDMVQAEAYWRAVHCLEGRPFRLGELGQKNPPPSKG